MSKQTQTVAYNAAHLNRMLAEQARAVATGDTCPKCGGGTNPTIVARFGHCIRCQSAAFGR